MGTVRRSWPIPIEVHGGVARRAARRL